MFIFDTLMLLLNGIEIPKGQTNAVELKKRVSKLFKNIKFRIEKTQDLNNNHYTIAGFYIEELEQIEIILIIPKNTNGLLSIEDPHQFRFHIAQTIQHEYIHHQQFLKRDELPLDSFSLCPKGSEEQKYLAERDEIDAYSYDIAIEVQRNGWKNSQTLGIYRKQFSSYHPVMKRLLKKAYKNLGVLNERHRKSNGRNDDNCKRYVT